ncbi:putative uncharacterized protein DDB_G0267716 [Contarinia nasturtii]|uniref:putative uncharacterized protein DDB_G0267716 n=1 Tax=Contarinia nasturtii TaxID=265458 RepID=UPI0012D464B4|nr:putative uncharacterized protein DDB_G0267716 [Contarinia nasturtii]
MFMEIIDWENPRFSQWHLENLGKLNQAQSDAFLDDDEAQDLKITETEQMELCEKVPCRVELFHSNVCYGVEKSWPKFLFKKDKLDDLSDEQRRIMYCKMVKYGVKLYKKYVDKDRLETRRKIRTNFALAPYLEEYRLKKCFNRIKALGELEQPEQQMSSDSESSLLTVIETQKNNNNSVHSEHSESNGVEIEHDSRIIYEHSSEDDEDKDDDEFLSANEGDFETDASEVAVMATPIIQQLRQNRNIQSSPIDLDVSNAIETDESIAMVVEVETESNHQSETKSEPSSGDRNITNIDERYNYLFSEGSVSSSRKNGDDDETVHLPLATPDFNSSQFVVINSNRLNQRFEGSENSSDLSPNRYQLRTRIQSPTETKANISHNKKRLSQSFNERLNNRSTMSPNRYQLRKRKKTD